MEIRSEKLEGLNGRISIKLGKADYEEKVDNALKDIRKKVDMKGFRKGMVPMGLIQKMYKTSTLVDEINKIISNSLFEHIYAEKLNILGEPLASETQNPIDWETQEEFEFHFDIGFAPDIEFNFPESAKYPYYKITPSEETLQARLDNYLANYGQVETQDEVDTDSLIKADMEEIIAEGSDKAPLVAPGKTFLFSKVADEAVQQALLGKKEGEQVTLSLSKSFTNKTDLASMLGVKEGELEGLSDDFKLTLVEITGYKKAAINQELFDKIYGENEVTTEEEFKERIKAEVLRDFEYDTEYKFTFDLKDKITQDLAFDLPVEFLKRWLEKTDDNIKAEDVERDWHLYEKDLRWQLIKDKIEHEQHVEVTEEDMLDMAKSITLAQFRQYGFASLPEEELVKFAQQVLSNEEQRKRITQSKKDEKIHAALKTVVPLETIEISQEDFTKMLEADNQEA